MCALFQFWWILYTESLSLFWQQAHECVSCSLSPKNTSSMQTKLLPRNATRGQRDYCTCTYIHNYVLNIKLGWGSLYRQIINKHCGSLPYRATYRDYQKQYTQDKLLLEFTPNKRMKCVKRKHYSATSYAQHKIHKLRKQNSLVESLNSSTQLRLKKQPWQVGIDINLRCFSKSRSTQPRPVFITVLMLLLAWLVQLLPTGKHSQGKMTPNSTYLGFIVNHIYLKKKSKT